MTTSSRRLLLVLTLTCWSSATWADAVSWCDVPAQGLSPTARMQKSLSIVTDTPPSPMALLHTEGSLPSDPLHKASLDARKDLPRMLDAALSWRVSGDPAALQAVQRYLDAWVSTYRPSMNPIDETYFDALFQSYAIVAPALPASETARIRPYLRNWAQGYIASIDAAGNATRDKSRIGKWNSNWQSHRVKIVTMIAGVLNDDRLFAEARRLFRQQVATNIDGKTGETLDFIDRDAVHYVVFDLEPLAEAALVAQGRGEDWYHWSAPSGSSLAKAMEWLRPYATGEKTHDEFVHSRVKFDAERAAAGMKGYDGAFDPTFHADLYWYASKFDPSFHAIASKLQPVPPTELAYCGR